MQSFEPATHESDYAVFGSELSGLAGTSPSGSQPSKSRVLIAYGTRFGNTQRIAEALAAGMRKVPGLTVECRYIDDVSVESLGRYDLLAIGGPTEIMSASKPMKEFLAKLPTIVLPGKRGFAFDTRLEGRMSGSAGKFIERSLERLGVKIVRPHASALVRGMNKEERALHGNEGAPDWVRKLDKSIQRESTTKRARLDLLYPSGETAFEQIGHELGEQLANSPSPDAAGKEAT